VLPDVSTGTIFRGVIPFYVLDLVRISILIGLPIITIWLPSHMR
jgi:TRAP-type mannitol/chloroaromatic compound transport system permease large subunit